MKHKIIIAGLILASLFSSCNEDYLDAPAQSTLDEALIFSDPGLARDAVNGIKITFGDTNSYRGRYLPFYGFNTDTEWYNAGGTTSNDKPDLGNYSATPTNSNMNIAENASGGGGQYWTSMYRGIERANKCIKGLREFGNPVAGSELGNLLGQALTLRAIFYADLIKAHGDVPGRFEPVTSATLYMSRTNRDIIYKQIIADLGEAATLVPWPNETTASSSVEEINKAFIKAFRARLAMVASGYQQYPDGVRRSTDPELSVANMYALALKEAREVIQSGKASLNPSFETFWKNVNNEVLTAGGESLWEIPFAPGRGKMLISFAVVHNAIDQYQIAGNGGIGGSAGPLPTVFYDYDQADTRRDVTCVPYFWGKATQVDGKPRAKQELGVMNKWYFGKYRFEWMTRQVSNKDDDGVNKVYMRYAEVLLIAAEAANEIEGVAAAAPYLKEIRKRAFNPADHATKVDAYVNALTDKTAMFKAIVNENKYELTGEMERKQSLIRWNLLKTNLDEAKTKMFNLQQRAGEYANVPVDVYYKYAADNETLIVYGLNRGENLDPGSTYTLLVDDKGLSGWNSLSDEKINSLYKVGVDPDVKQYWPIWQVLVSASNGQLSNSWYK
ncbi:RagB/SusD family nutrient uptake outer membrane protein [Flavobacterium sp. RS13.1]|uniref:RagB/SusD family nutrient uptake outer membrane protein n=1 Tax=Flavobacterium sp. RS13.1 TaxID=3400345 RepID=UPI003AAB7C6C